MDTAGDRNVDGKEKKKLSGRFQPTTDFMRAKLTLGLKLSLKYEAISMEEVQMRFMEKNIQVIFVVANGCHRPAWVKQL